MSTEEKKVVVIGSQQDILDLLDKGYSREMIRDHYGLTNFDVTEMFKDPLLKGRKAKKQPAFTWQTDLNTEGIDELSEEATVEEVVAEEVEIPSIKEASADEIRASLEKEGVLSPSPLVSREDSPEVNWNTIAEEVNPEV